MGAAQNLTVRLDKSVIHKARVLAARRGSSISRLVAETIEQLAAAEDDYELSLHAALEDLEEGLPLGGPPYLARDETHDRS